MINIISSAGHQGEPGNVGYGTGKGGLLNFTRSVAMELAEHGIRVNSLTPPPPIRPKGLNAPRDGASSGQDRGLENGDGGCCPTLIRGLPTQKRPSPRHYGKAAVFLASDDAEMITGFDLRVDAGAYPLLAVGSRRGGVGAPGMLSGVVGGDYAPIGVSFVAKVSPILINIPRWKSPMRAMAISS